MSWDSYLKLSIRQEHEIQNAIDEMIDATGGEKPKDYR